MFQSKRVVITGASSGIGAELAVQLVEQGARVVVAARTAKGLDEAVARCKAKGGEAHAIACDVADQEACRSLIAESVKLLGGLDALVNNAGIVMRARFDEISDLSIFERIMKVNYLGSVYCTHYALPELKKTRGLIVAVSSVTGKVGVPTRTGYSASKHAMQGFFDSLRIELKRDGVDVLVVCPGAVSTGIRARAVVATTGVSEEAEEKAMTTEDCTRLIVEAMAGRKREIVTQPGMKLAQLARLFIPDLVDRRIAREAAALSKAK